MAFSRLMASTAMDNMATASAMIGFNFLNTIK
jgi:hypothetical protein